MTKIDIEKFICSLFSTQFSTEEKERIMDLCKSHSIYAPTKVMLMAVRKALREQGLIYKNRELVSISDIHVFKDLPNEERLKWYICIKAVGDNPPLFIEGEPTPLDKIEKYCPDITPTQFIEHFRKVTEADLVKAEHKMMVEAITNEPLEPAVTTPSGFSKKIAFSDKSDINAMVEEYKERVKRGELQFSARTLLEASLRDYRNGLEDMYYEMKK